MPRILEPDYGLLYTYAMNSDEVKRIRHALGLKKSQFARVLGTTYQVVHKWENGKPISPQYATRIQQIETERILKSE